MIRPIQATTTSSPNPTPCQSYDWIAKELSVSKKTVTEVKKDLSKIELNLTDSLGSSKN